MVQRRYGLVGCGSRARMYVGAMTGAHAADAALVALGDTNPGRAQFHRDAAVAAGAQAPRLFHPDDLERVIADERLDRVVVTSPDHTHADLVSRSLLAGADVVVEKPLTTDADGARRIVEAVRISGRSVVMTFNYRYSPRNTALKRVIASGAIGTVTSVHFEWVLDTKHGADYFRRWHRRKDNSGGLLVHKASHHFDLVNWWIDDEPRRVFASGGLRFYGAKNAAARGLGPRPARGTGGDASDPFQLDLRSDELLQELYLDNEQHDGYVRDQDVFSGDIDIEDNLSLVVDYAGGPSMSYSLNAHAPWEGYTVAVNGTAGRAELTVVERGAVTAEAWLDPSAVPEARDERDERPVSERLLVQEHWGTAREVPIENGAGGHGGGDVKLLRDVFVGPGEDPLGTPADYTDGVRAVAVGIAGNASLATGRAVPVDELGLWGRG
ncbi:Gfo/Idh/MocA family oxidoreductase [Paenibacillus sp. TRM 82003]|uniref:Gfo/Idh/MocA family protein n=1 Tax=Kineococcus sp. TRM81007 TaxID=2925831 RepID=UPI001F5AD118|nr:Gfo/Idh/MocA family oxidoreductase [Kineococcus sp. TRM81007]MCI2240299.1 Gfo/Idh/MocA family oxidoreductase [Kineococcus sp. TRM81007]MCI3927523.1 Gfo/Idh/MocA family oxidoreductase [Paenibacillus sp. TRM 82003]